MENTIAIVTNLGKTCTMWGTNFYSELLAGIEKCCLENGCDLLISSQRSWIEPADYLKTYRNGKASGLILIAPEEKHPQLPIIASEKIPAVVIGSNPPVEISYVDSDNRNGMAKVTEFYRKQGLVFLRFGSSEKIARFMKYDANVEVVIQNPWKDAKTGAMMTDTLILIYKKDGKGNKPDVSI